MKRVVLATWLLLAGAGFTAASVPAYRAPWSMTVTVRNAGNGMLIGEPVTHFVTPFLSFAEIRFASGNAANDAESRVVLAAGAEPLGSIQDVDRRALITMTTAAGRKGRAIQFRPVETVRVVVVGPATDDHADVTFGYDGQSTAVSVIHYWWPWLVGGFLIGSVLLLSPFTWPFQTRCVDWISRVMRTHRPVVWLLLGATALRFTLVIRGGQYFDWDEVRYGGGAAWAFSYLSTGNFNAALGMLLKAPDHPGFRVVGLVPAFFHVVSAWNTGQPVTEMRYPSGEWLPAFLLSLASALSIAVTYALAYRTGASRRESFLAAFLMFCSASMLMYARHFFPYDAAMAILLLALWIGVSKSEHPVRSFGVGLLAGFAFLTYEGYWLMAALAGCVHALRKPCSVPLFLKRSAAFVAGLLTPLMLLAGAGYLEGQPFLERLDRFSRTVVNGDFSEGWSLPWAYFWHVEHGLLFVYAFGIGALVTRWVRRRDPDLRYALTWLAAACAIYLGLVLGSNVFHRLVVYDRLARQMIPFMCLAAAAGLTRMTGLTEMTSVTSVTMSRFLYGVIAILFIWNVVPFLSQRFPRDIVREAVRTYGAANIRVATSLLHTDDATAEAFLSPEISAPSGPATAKRYVLLNVKDIWARGGELESIAPPAGKDLLAVRHPRQLRALQYHGYRPAERSFLRSVDFSMRLIDTRSF